ncbi:MAG TPA: fibronectin type III domain-containing protein, partial [Spirochaetales bacterium]|nr:fibronectin type III domain-containing protein [Spirochaetales bacterium]
SITFAWAGADTSSGIAGYYVDGTFTADTDGSASVPLAASATAHVVYVVDNAGNESYRLNITVTQDTDKPTIGSDSLVDADYPTVALRTNGTMTLTFTPTDTGSGISRYTVEGACSSVAVTSGLTSGSPVERGLSGITASGDIVLTVYDGVGNNETKTYTVTFDNSPPANVTGFTATANAGSSITLKWTDPTASDFDHVHISWTINGSAGSSADIEAEEEEYTISDLTENDVVVFTVSTVDTIGNASSGDVMGGSTTVLASRYSSQTSSRASPTASTAFTAFTASTAAAAAATTSARPGSRAITSPKATSPETKSASWVTPPTPAGRARSEAVSATTGAARADASTAARAAASSRSEAAEAKAPTTAATASDEPDATPPATVVRHSTAQSVSAAGGSGAAATPSSAASSVAFAGSTVGGPATAAFNGSAQAVADGPGGSNAEAAPTTSGLGMPSDTPDAPRAPDGTGSRRPVQAVMPGRGGCGRRDEETEGDER